MTNNLTIIESEVLDILLEKAFLYDIVSENNQLLYEEDMDTINQQIKIRKANFLSKYVEVSMTFDKTIVDGLEARGYE